MADFDDKLNSLLSNPEAMSQIMKLAQSLSDSGESTASQQQPAPEPPPPSSASSSGSSDLLSMLTGGIDPKLMIKLLPLIQELGGQQDNHARQLLYALRPYLKENRQDKIERALQLARLFRVGKKFLTGWED